MSSLPPVPWVLPTVFAAPIRRSRWRKFSGTGEAILRTPYLGTLVFATLARETPPSRCRGSTFRPNFAYKASKVTPLTPCEFSPKCSRHQRRKPDDFTTKTNHLQKKQETRNTTLTRSETLQQSAPDVCDCACSSRPNRFFQLRKNKCLGIPTRTHIWCCATAR